MEREATVINGVRTYPAPSGPKTVYIEHAIWQDPDGTMQYTIGNTQPREIPPDDPRDDVYRAVLAQHGRWAEDANR